MEANECPSEGPYANAIPGEGSRMGAGKCNPNLKEIECRWNVFVHEPSGNGNDIIFLGMAAHGSLNGSPSEWKPLWISIQMHQDFTSCVNQRLISWASLHAPRHLDSPILIVLEGTPETERAAILVELGYTNALTGQDMWSWDIQECIPVHEILVLG